jgi:hypothetical protein
LPTTCKPLFTTRKSVQFADDTQLADSYDPKSAESIFSVEIRLCNDLHHLATWCNNNRLLLDLGKTFAVCIGHPDIIRIGLKPKLSVQGFLAVSQRNDH